MSTHASEEKSSTKPLSLRFFFVRTLNENQTGKFSSKYCDTDETFNVLCSFLGSEMFRNVVFDNNRFYVCFDFYIALRMHGNFVIDALQNV